MPGRPRARIFKYPRHSGETIATPLNVRLFSFELAADVSSSFPPVSSREGPALTRWARERNIYFSRICLENLENPSVGGNKNWRLSNNTRTYKIVKYSKIYIYIYCIKNCIKRMMLIKKEIQKIFAFDYFQTLIIIGKD